jgi:hypothetical protein
MSALKDVSANVGELVMATGSIGDFNGPVVFVGDTAVAGGYKPVSKIYQGATAPSISVGSHGSTMDGLPFYSTTTQTLYILDKSGNSGIDLTGNIEGNLISGVTINNLTGLTANISGSMTVTGPTNINGNVFVTGNTIQTGSIDITGNIVLGGNITIGDSNTDIINFGGEVSSSIIPDIHGAFDLGTPAKNWRNLHVSGTAYVDTLQARQVDFANLDILEDLSVSGNTYLGNGGDITVISGSIYNDQLTEKRLVVVGTNGLLTNYSGLTFDNGNLNLSGALEVTNIQGTGSLYLKADKNDSRYFEIYNTATVDTHIKSNGGMSFFGDDTNYLKIDDSLQTATIVGVNGVIISSSLQVTGSAQFSSTINVDGVATVSSSVVEDLTQYRVVGVGSGGALIDYSGLTYNGTTLKVGNGQFEVDNIDGDIRTSGSLTTNGLTNNGDLTVNGVLTVTGNTQLQANLYVSGNLEVLGSATNVTIQSQTVEIDDNIIRMNAYSPFLRYAGFEVIDSGSVGVSASFVWDSLNDYWMFVSASGESSKLIGTTAGTYGSENSLTNTYFPIATGTNTIGDSLLRYSGTTLSLNTNKFTVDSSTGDALVSGNFTLSYSGGTDNGSKTSAIMFRNSSNVVGFVSTTETTDVLDGLLGYKNSNGGLVFSTVIDGGTY